MKQFATAATRRKSVRKFDESLHLSESELQKVKDILTNATPLVEGIATEFEIVPCSQTNCKFNAEYCLLFYSEEKPLWVQNAGYLLEQWDLSMLQLGIGVCWYGMGKAEEKERNGKKYVVMLAFGKSDDVRTNVDQFTRNALKANWEGNFDQTVASLAQLAPSAVNSQPWKVVWGSKLDVYQIAKTLNPLSQVLCKWFNKMDMGIFLVFLETALENSGYTFERVLHDDGDLKGKKPLATYVLNKQE